jgi:hypothetical protein
MKSEQKIAGPERDRNATKKKELNPKKIKKKIKKTLSQKNCFLSKSSIFFVGFGDVRGVCHEKQSPTKIRRRGGVSPAPKT